MAYVELHHYKQYALEVREFGDSGWAVHVYAPLTEGRAKKVAIVTTTSANELERVLADAKFAAHDDLTRRSPA